VSELPSVALVRHLPAPPDRVFAAWTRPEMMACWYGPHRTTVERAESDLRVGGRFRVVMREATGELHDVSGLYREVVQDHRLVFTWTWRATPDHESLVTVTLRAVDDGTELTLLHQRLADVPARDDHAHGWGEALERLARLVESA
jgi:uncharacterized protein YndB with AHSA1/START domain